MLEERTTGKVEVTVGDDAVPSLAVAQVEDSSSDSALSASADDVRSSADASKDSVSKPQRIPSRFPLLLASLLTLGLFQSGYGVYKRFIAEAPLQYFQRDMVQPDPRAKSKAPERVAVTTRRVEKGEVFTSENVAFVPPPSKNLKYPVVRPENFWGRKADAAVERGSAIDARLIGVDTYGDRYAAVLTKDVEKGGDISDSIRYLRYDKNLVPKGALEGNGFYGLKAVRKLSAGSFVLQSDVINKGTGP